MGQPVDMTDLEAIDIEPGAAFLSALENAWERGNAVLPLARNTPVTQRHRLAQRLGARWLVTGAAQENQRRIELDRHRPLTEGDALVVATSGTTGDPKGAILTHRAIEYAAYATATALGTAADTHWVACLPLSHVGGFSVLTRALYTRAQLTILPRFDPEQLEEALEHGATHVSLVHTALRRLDPSPWQRILLGGSAAPEHLPPNCVTTYGMTETFGGVVYDGLALNGVEMRIATSGGTGSDDPVGPVELRSPTMMRAYRGVEGAPDRVPFDDQGWFRTGDLGSISDDERRLSVAGRADDLIITGGEKVWPTPVEARLETHPGVDRAVVMGRSNEEWGQLVTAVIVPTDPGDPVTLDELRTWVRETMPVACAPKALELVVQLPMTALGKVIRSELA